MSYFTTETYSMKRDILKFSEKISEGTCKSVKNLCKDVIYGISASRSSHLSEIARTLKENTKLPNTIDRLSSGLADLDDYMKRMLIQNCQKEIMKLLPDNEVIVLNDDTDLNKEYSKKLEDLCTVRDASSQTEKYVNGYKVCEYIALSRKSKTPISLYSKIYSTKSDEFKSENDETINGEDYVVNLLNENNKTPIFIRDRGYDANEFFKKDIKEGNKFVTRLKGNRNLRFKDKLRLVKEVALERKGKVLTTLMYKGENRECYISYAKVSLPCMKEKQLTLLTIHGLNTDDDLPMMLLTNIEIEDANTARKIAKLYFLRWRIEEYFKTKKEEFGWENSLLRTLKSMNNFNMFLTLVMFYMATIVEKLDTNYFCNIIVERAMALKEDLIIMFGIISKGIYNILKYARNGISEWKHIKHKEKDKQLSFKLAI